MELFKGFKQTQVIRAVADKGKRPENPQGASASPDVVPLMEQRWKQDPADRPYGFGPVVRDKRTEEEREHEPPMVVGRMSDSDDLEVAKNLLNQADGLQQQGKYCDADSPYLRVIEIQEKMPGPA
ncbi:hypothetical protein Esi_0037_0068 [Ectocarpus siliculosus]|uniref:Uncharacterized protein n=1 Tax=Ectocarpus siliculosus TaxID=2880 RepID=D8LLM4_ECTSI|nr:hypothetical protein Esi_0037_0068 [Ectocarpus siliculosus]|eukprot:CBN74655.1 hypothetical protein Esi_0037_0068 [Ectocarpus siliculosus]